MKPSLFIYLAISLAGLVSVSGANAGAGAHYHLVRAISMPGNTAWDYIKLDRHRHRLYITRGTHVAVLNIEAGKQVGDIAGLGNAHGIAFDDKRGQGYISDGQANSVVVFRLSSMKKLGSVPVGAGPDSLVFEPATSRVFTFNGEANTATVLDAVTHKMIGTIALPGRPEFAVADDRGHVYDNIEDKSEIVEIDAKRLKVINTWAIAPGQSPSGLSLDTKSRHLFAVCANKRMVVMSADTGKVLAMPMIGRGPDATSFDPTLKRVYSSNGRDGTMSVVSEVGGQYGPVLTFTTRPGARTMTIDTETHHIYTVTAKSLPDPPGTAPGPSRRLRRYVPGSFVVLEFAP